MVAYITSVIEVCDTPFPVDAHFDQYGLDSVEVVIMAGMIEEQFGVEINLESAFENPCVAALSDYVVNRIADQPLLE